jgi:probable rRNA maturation factor
VLRLLNQNGLALSVVFVSPREMRAMNRRYLGRDYATDVLSFSYDDIGIERRLFLGEIVIAPQIAVLQAARYGTRPEKEIRKLLVHGILHLLGYNHETDRGRMDHLQAKILRRKSLANSPALVKRKETQ